MYRYADDHNYDQLAAVVNRSTVYLTSCDSAGRCLQNSRTQRERIQGVDAEAPETYLDLQLRDAVLRLNRIPLVSSRT